jgi:Domain of unknown function (DUF4189)
MHRAAFAAVGVLLLASAFAAAAPAQAAEFGALAYDARTGNAGWSIKQPTPHRAEEVALGNCGASDCKIVLRVKPRMCVALARVAGEKHIGAAARPNRDAARLAALADCKKAKKGECVVRFSDCNR